MGNFVRKYKKFLLLFIAIIVISYIVLAFNNINEKDKEEKISNIIKQEYINNVSTSKQYELCRNFVLNKLMNAEGGVYTNYLDKPSNVLTKGHDILSESQGLIMCYAIQINDRELFERAWSFAERNLMTDKKLFTWRLSSQNSGSTASVDDLRIAGALYSGAVLFSNTNYRNVADKISKALYKYCVKRGILTDGYDSIIGISLDQMHSSYLDIGSMRKLAVYNKHWEKIYKNSLILINKGRISEDIPLFYDQYDIKTQSYYESGKISTLTSMLTLYYLCQTDNYKQEDIDWINLKLTNDAIFLEYDRNGKATSNMQSSAVYAIIMLIAQKIGDNSLYSQSKSLLNKLQVIDPNSEIFGSFGNNVNLDVYSFDNLFSMWALASDGP